MLNVIVDAPYKQEDILVKRSQLMNLVTASGQNGYAQAYAKQNNLPALPYMLASPVWLNATHNDVLLNHDCANADLHRVYKEFVNFVQQDKWQVYSIEPNLWLVAPTLPVFKSAPVFDIAQRSLKPFLDAWPVEWLQWFTEIQMLLQTLPFSPCNAVWVWGGGDFVMPPESSFRFMDKKDAQQLMQNKQSIHWWWQDCDFVQAYLSPWQRIKKWCCYGN